MHYVQKDDMEQIKQDILSADMVVFANASLLLWNVCTVKILIDRF